MATTETELTNRQQRDVQPKSLSKNTASNINVSEVERYASAIGGAALALYGLSRKSFGGMVLGLVGTGLVYRGVTGYSNLYEAMNINTATGNKNAKGLLGGRGTRVVKGVTIKRPRAELYSFWRNFENLPQFMNHLESVKVIDHKRSHWVAKAPVGTTVEWDAEITRETENRSIAWHSLKGADVDNAGTVRFDRLPGGHETRIVVSIEYVPPGGTIGAAIAKLFGEEPEQQLEEDLQRFKELMEATETSAKVEDESSTREGSGGRTVTGLYRGA